VQDRAMSDQLDDILISTMNDVPGYEIVTVYGEVFGLIVRARNVSPTSERRCELSSAAKSADTPGCLPTAAFTRSSGSAQRPRRKAPTQQSRCASIATRSQT
jgi:hypothetical protein